MQALTHETEDEQRGSKMDLQAELLKTKTEGQRMKEEMEIKANGPPEFDFELNKKQIKDAKKQLPKFKQAIEGLTLNKFRQEIKEMADDYIWSQYLQGKNTLNVFKNKFLFPFADIAPLASEGNLDEINGSQESLMRQLKAESDGLQIQGAASKMSSLISLIINKRYRLKEQDFGLNEG